jgi:membrane-associated phospholipid phosphatase
LPIWYAFPATTPRDAFWLNRNTATYGEDIEIALNDYQPNKQLNSFLNREGLITIPDDTIPITSMPSMHIAWSTVVLYFSWIIGWPLLIFIIPYYILNFAATMFTLQHYAVDTIGGLLVAIIAILISKIIYPIKPVSKPTLTTIIQKDLAIFKQWLKSSKNK